MKCMLMGARDLEFKNDNGERVEGTSLYLAYETEGVTGYEVSKVFISPEKKPENLLDYVGSDIGVDFNQKGKVISIELA